MRSSGVFAAGAATSSLRRRIALTRRLQLENGEGFGQIIVRAELEAEHAIEFAGLGGQHQDRGS